MISDVSCMSGIDMADFLSEYSRLAAACQTVAYDDAESVQKFNRASDRMRQIVRDANSAGPETLLPLADLLTDPVSRRWIAHHLVELATIDTITRNRCLDIVRDTAASLERDGQVADAMGERMWLKKWSLKDADR